MYQFLTKNGQVLAFGIGVVLIVIFLAISVSGAGNYNFADMTDAEMRDVTIFDFGLWASIILSIAASVSLVFFGIYHVVTDIKGSGKGLLGLLGLVAIYVIAYVLAPGEAGSAQLQNSIDKFAESGNGVITAGNLKFIGGSITTSLILVGVAVVAMISSVVNIFK